MHTVEVKKTYAYLFLLLAPMLVTAYIWFFFARPGEPKLTVAFLDVGQGDAILIETPSRHQVLIDGGAGNEVLGALARELSFFDRTIDIVIGTHPDKDHIGGLPGVFNFFRVFTVLDPGTTSDTAAYRAYAESVAAEGARHISARRGQRISFGDGVYLDVLYPDRDMQGITDDNSASVVVRVVYGETEVLLTGDAPQSVENYLVMLGTTTLASDILKAGHHGSKTSSGSMFLEAVHPRYTIISAGKGNTYGHPHEETLARLRAASTTILATYDVGNIVFESDGKTFRKR